MISEFLLEKKKIPLIRIRCLFHIKNHLGDYNAKFDDPVSISVEEMSGKLEGLFIYFFFFTFK